MQSNRGSGRVKVSADGTGLVSRAGTALLRELADACGLTGGWTEALLDTYRAAPIHQPGAVLRDLAVVIADGGDALAHLGVLRDQAKLFGAVDIDPTISIAHSENKENAAATWKHTFGFHPLLSYLDRSEISGGEALAGLLRAGNAGSNTAADHIEVLDLSLAALPNNVRPGNRKGIRLLVRTDAAGATHAFATAVRDRGCEFSFGFPVDERVQQAVLALP